MEQVEKNEAKIDVIDLLLRADSPKVTAARQTAELEVKRLTKAFGAPFRVTVRGLSYNQYMDIMAGSGARDVDVVLAGVVSPNLRDPRLLEHYGVPTPGELVPAIFLPGEISDLAKRVERLTGFRQTMLEEVKKN